jgi:hypothetical protein
MMPLGAVTMLLPLMGLFMVGLPVAGVFAGLFFLCVKRLRFLALFAFLMPVSGSYAAILGFWGTAIGLESLGMSEQVSGLGGLLGLVLAGFFGAWKAFNYAKNRNKAL